MSEIRNLALAVDAALDALEQAAAAYITEAERLDVAYRISHRDNPHPLHERRHSNIKNAVGSRIALARTLGLSPVNPGITLGTIHSD